MIPRGLLTYKDKRILLLQGPVGPFFRRFGKDLAKAGAQVFKVNLNGGDWLFYPTGSIPFTGDMDNWAPFLEDLLERLHIDTVILFGDCRAYHKVALDIARRRGLEIGVFEEGYIRPNYVTFEREGVNGFSSLPSNPIFYLNKVPSRPIRTDPVGYTFLHAAMAVCLYYIAAHLLRLFFPHYRHHRPLTVLEAFPWVKSAWRKAHYRLAEKGIHERLTGPLSKRFFLVPLQVHNDSQIRVHSQFTSVAEFIRHTVESFSKHAAPDTTLVIKHHPMDRGYADYSGLLKELRNEFGLGERLLYIHDQHLPSLLHHARGVIVINSTVGLSAIFHKAPVKVCGTALYDIKGLSYQGPLDHFWSESSELVIDSKLFNHFQSYLIYRTQFNGSFYKRLPIPGSFSGMRWEERWMPGDVERSAAEQFTPQNDDADIAGAVQSRDVHATSQDASSNDSVFAKHLH